MAFVVERLGADEFVDVSRLVGARLTFAHHVSTTGDKTEVSADVRISGPLAPVWRLILGKGIAASAQSDLERLAALAEADEQR